MTVSNSRIYWLNELAEKAGRLWQIQFVLNSLIVATSSDIPSDDVQSQLGIHKIIATLARIGTTYMHYYISVIKSALSDQNN